MSLDLFAPAIAAADQDVARNAARDLPAGFTEAFDISTRQISEWLGSANYNTARERALATFYDDVKATTGEKLPLYGMGGNVTLEELNDALVKIPGRDPESGYQPLSEDRIHAMALARMARAHGDAKAFEQRETTWGGTAGTIAGVLAAGLSDPVSVATLPLGGAGNLPIALRALEFAAIAGGTEAANAGLGMRDREAAVPGSSKEIPGEVATAALFGGAIGGVLGALAKVLGHGARPLPVTVRDEVNAAASELQLRVTNPFPTAAGEVAARDATVGATNSILRGEAVRVADDFAPVHVDDFARAAEADTPDKLAAAAERHLRPETFDEVPQVERFDAMPAAADDTASYWERRLAEASPEERAALGAVDGAAPAAPAAREIAGDVAVSARDLTPEQLVKLAADPQTESAVLINLDRIRVDRPDADYSVQVRQADGSYQLVTRKLEDVIEEIDADALLAKELEACAIGMAAE